MPIQKTGINLSALNNVSSPDFNLSTTASDIINDIPAVANQITGGFYGLIVLSGLFIYLMINLGDRLELRNLPYSSVRSVGIAAGVCAMMGFQMLNIGYFTEFFHVAIFAGITLIVFIWIWYEDRR